MMIYFFIIIYYQTLNNHRINSIKAISSNRLINPPPKPNPPTTTAINHTINIITITTHNKLKAAPAAEPPPSPALAAIASLFSKTGPAVKFSPGPEFVMEFVLSVFVELMIVPLPIRSYCNLLTGGFIIRGGSDLARTMGATCFLGFTGIDATLGTVFVFFTRSTKYPLR